MRTGTNTTTYYSLSFSCVVHTQTFRPVLPPRILQCKGTLPHTIEQRLSSKAVAQLVIFPDCFETQNLIMRSQDLATRPHHESSSVQFISSTPVIIISTHLGLFFPFWSFNFKVFRLQFHTHLSFPTNALPVRDL
jgi:hypothetical protein